jgi:uncharacterized protein DUF6526
MAERSPQTLANHVRFDPPFHFFVLPVFAISWIISVVLAVRHPGFLHVWIVIFNTALIVAVTKIRQYALKVQDRVIRLEEKLRLAALLPDSLRPHVAKLSEHQLIALRFARTKRFPRSLNVRCRQTCHGRTSRRRYSIGERTIAESEGGRLRNLEFP